MNKKQRLLWWFLGVVRWRSKKRKTAHAVMDRCRREKRIWTEEETDIIVKALMEQHP